MFAIVIRFHSSLILVDKAESVAITVKPCWGSTLVSSSLVCQYETGVEVNGSGKWQWQMASPLSYYDMETITAVKSLLVQVSML